MVAGGRVLMGVALLGRGQRRGGRVIQLKRLIKWVTELVGKVRAAT
jgi:hypothetical protein